LPPFVDATGLKARFKADYVGLLDCYFNSDLTPSSYY